MLKYRTARLAVEAQQADAEADLTTARFQLAAVAGLGISDGKTFPRLVSIPFAGRLPLPVSSPDRSWRAPSTLGRQRLEATLPRREQAILDQAAAVVQSDNGRAATTADFLAGRSSLDRVLAAIEVQARETSTYLRAVTEYNRAIAQYAIAILPANTDAEKLVAALMVEKSPTEKSEIRNPKSETNQK